ncbi:hypothetical protein GOB85_10090 [Acetobacter sp. LMG 1636]|uniref:Uncharacterized protein n=2 Tax=Acetobacter fallax TaxID=1737473 RepID=A0ABX0KBS6_9PROT|nr:hypothetical protein [Acetobacter fallax]NHO36456.1 hypothetical protein [Acetobacter fallax]
MLRRFFPIFSRFCAIRSYGPALVAAVVLAAGMVAGTPEAWAAGDAQSDPYGLWAGRLVTDQGSCPDQQDSVLQIDPDRLAFTPGTGVLTLRGRPDKDHKRFHAQLMMTDMNHHPLPMVFEGHPDGQTITGEFGTPSCRAHVVLKRPEGHALDNFFGR